MAQNFEKFYKIDTDFREVNDIRGIVDFLVDLKKKRKGKSIDF